MATEHDPQCPREKNTMIRPNDCIFCEVIRAVRSEQEPK